MKLQGTMSKLLGHVFAQIDGVVWDMMSNQTGIKREDGIYTLSKDGQVELNPFDSFSMELPAFSQLVPIDQVKRGDVLVSAGKPTGWVLEAGIAEDGEGEGQKTKSSIQALSFQGHQTRFRPKKVSMMGIENGITIVRSPFNFDGAKGSGVFGDMASMLPMLMLMGAKGAAGGMDMKTLAMMSMMGGSGSMGAMNPMMLMMLLGGDDKPGFPSR